MSKESITLETVEDMAKFATSHVQPWQQSRKYSLHSNTRWEWDSEAEAETWRTLEPDYVTQPVEYKAWQELRPAMHLDGTYYLSEQGNSYHGETIYLAPALFAILDDIWTKREAYRGSTQKNNIGGLTILGMLKRLGKTEIKGQVDAALKAAQDQEAANLKAGRQETARRLAKELAEFMARFPGDTQMTFTVNAQGITEA